MGALAILRGPIKRQVPQLSSKEVSSCIHREVCKYLPARCLSDDYGVTIYNDTLKVCVKINDIARCGRVGDKYLDTHIGSPLFECVAHDTRVSSPSHPRCLDVTSHT